LLTYSTTLFTDILFRTSPGQTIVIEPDDPKMRLGALYVAVYAVTPANYSITATSGVKG
jgi:hypothetical protein